MDRQTKVSAMVSKAVLGLLFCVLGAARINADCSLCIATEHVLFGPSLCGDYTWALRLTTTTEGTVDAGWASGTGACNGGYWDCNGNYVPQGNVPASISSSAVPYEYYDECDGTWYTVNYLNPHYSACPPDSPYPAGSIETVPYVTLDATYSATC
jgi:hypothetical protein